MARHILTALDIGTSTITTAVGEWLSEEEQLRMLGIGVVASRGVRRGAIVDLEDATTAIRASIEEASKHANVPIRSVWVGVSGAHISVSSSRGIVAVSRADGEISPEDVRRAIAAAETFIPKNLNKEILHVIARDFKVDNEAGIKDPVGMHGIRLEADTLIIECSSPFLKNLLKCVEGAGVKADDVVFGPLAAAEAMLTKRQKELGVVLLDVGGGTASFIVFEEGVPIHAGVIPLGGMHITNDIAIGFRTHVDLAEQIKLAYGSCLPGEMGRKEAIRLAEILGDTLPRHRRSKEENDGKPSVKLVASPEHTRRELAEIIAARVQDIFELLQKELKKINRTALLPAGVVLVGGTANLPGLTELTKQELKLPAERGTPHEWFGALDERAVPSLAVVLGTLKWAHAKTYQRSNVAWTAGMRHFSNTPWIKWLKSLLP